MRFWMYDSERTDKKFTLQLSLIEIKYTETNQIGYCRFISRLGESKMMSTEHKDWEGGTKKNIVTLFQCQCI